MPVAEIQGQPIFFHDIGSGDAIVLGHSFLCTSEMWCEQISALEHGYRIINLDFRGHGRSAPAHKPFSLYDAVEDVVGVLDLLGIERAVWCGLSIGGMVALRAALTVPDRVAALVVLDSDAGAEALLRILKYRLMGVGVTTVGLRPFLPTICRLMFGATTRRNNPRLVNEWRRIFAGADVPSALQCLDTLIGRDSVISRLSDILVPSLVMVGQEDRSLPVPLSRRIHDGLCDSELVVIRGAGHLSALEEPGQVNVALKKFLRRVSRSATAA
jgi:pimeloyl-ACP methyl ester carboxylesterase